MMNEDDFFRSLSATLMVLDVISAILIADFAVRHRWSLKIGAGVRFCLMLLAVGLLLHSAEQVQILSDYRPPRARSWIWIFFSLHALIWTAWFRAHRKARQA